MVCFLPYLTLYYQSVGLSGRQIGLLAGLPPLIMLIAAPFWSGLADATHKHKLILLLAIAGSLTAIILLTVTDRYIWLAVLVMTNAFFTAPMMPLVDNTALDLLGPRKSQYGRLRLWGAIGWGVTAPLIGWLIERNDITWAFYGYLVMMGIGFFVASGLVIRPVSIGGRFWHGMQRLLADRRWLIFLGAGFTGGVSLAMVNNFLFLQLDALGASRSLMGLSLTVATLSEVVVMYYAGAVMRRISALGMLLLSLYLYGLRALSYAWMPVAWLVLPIQLFHGLTFSASWVAGVAIADELAPHGLGATAQGLFSGVAMGLGSAAGAFLGGVLYQALGPALMFQWTGLGTLLCALIFTLAGRGWLRQERFALQGEG
jgi:PPP family 3-phenylpropionic acid transporter